jgi:hypothetical protein
MVSLAHRSTGVEKGRLKKEICGIYRAKFHGRFLRSAQFLLQNGAKPRRALKKVSERIT